jgi:pimeloyl-ACP methyl ester carboxylesterase
VQTIQADGLRIAYRRSGSGPPLFLVHGALSDSRYWNLQADGLSDELTVLAWDEPGAGQSDDLPEDFALADYARCLASLIEEVDLGPSAVCGLSWGGVVALELYRQRPHLVASLILADSYAGWKGSLPADEVEARVEGVRHILSSPTKDFTEGFPGMFGSAPNEAAIRLIEEMAASSRPRSVEIQLGLIAGTDQRQILKTIEVPTLLIWGGEDVRSPLSVARQFHSAISDSQLVVIEGAGHVSNLEQPERFNDAIRRFCRAQS